MLIKKFKNLINKKLCHSEKAFNKFQNLKLPKLTEIILFILIISIPFYQTRIYFCKTSLSFLSLTEIIFIFFTFFEIIFNNFQTQIKKVKDIYQENRYFFNLVFLLLFTLFFSVLKTNTFHAFGIFVEWFILPILANFCLLFYLKENKYNILILKKIIIFVFSLVLIISLTYWLKENLTYDFRLKAFYSSPNHLAMFLSSLFFLFFSFSLEEKNKIKKFVLYSILFLSLIILFKTNSLINLGLVFLGINLYFFWFSKRKIIWITFILITFFTLFLAVKIKIPDWKIIWQKNSIQSRLVIYEVSVNLIRENLFLGNLVNFQEKYLEQQKFYPPYPEWAVPTPHDFFLMNLFSGGLIFTILFFVIIFYWLTEIILVFKKEKNEISKKIVFLYLITTLIFLFQGVFDTPYWKNDLAFLFWLTIILGINNKKYSRKN